MQKSVLKGVSADAFIMTAVGYKRVSDITPGDIAIASDGTSHEIISVIDEGERPALRISGSSSVPFAVSMDTEMLLRVRCKAREREISRDIAFRPVSDISGLGDNGSRRSSGFLVGLPVNQERKKPVWEGIDLFRGDTYVRRKDLDPKDPGLWYLMGLYLKHGHTPFNPRKGPYRLRYSKVIITADPSSEAAIRKNIGTQVHFSIQRIASSESTCVFSLSELAEFLVRLGRTASEKRIPYDFFKVSSEYMRAVIAGYTFKDRERIEELDDEYGKARIVSVNSALILSLAHAIDKGFHTVPLIQTTVGNAPRKIGDRVIEMSDYHNLDFHVKELPRVRSFYDEGHVWYTIRDTENISCRLYRIEAEGNADFIVSRTVLKGVPSA